MINTIKTSGHTSLEKYTFHTLFLMVRKGYERVIVWEVSWRLNKDCNILIPSSSDYSSISFSSCGAAQPEALRVQLSAGSGSHCLILQQLTPNSDLQLTRTSCSTGLYNCLTPTCFSERRIYTQFNPSTVKVIPWYLRRDSPVIYTGVFLIWQLSRVGGQYVTECRVFFFLCCRCWNKSSHVSWCLDDWENRRARVDSEESHKQKRKGVRKKHPRRGLVKI